MFEKMRKYKIYYVASIVAMLFATLGFSYAYFEGSITNNVNIEYEVGFAKGYNLVTSPSNTTIALSPSALDMYYNPSGSYKEASQVITVSLENSEDYPMQCTYDVVWTWDSASDSYSKTSAAKEFTATIVDEVQLQNSSSSTTILSKNTIIAGVGETSVLKHNVALRFYNLPNDDQSAHAGKNYIGNVSVKNVKCDGVSKLNNLLVEPVYQLDADANQGYGVTSSTTTTTWKPIYGSENATLSNFGSTSTSGWNGKYLAFDGVDDFVKVPLEDVFKGDATIQIRLKFNESNARDVILGNYRDDNGGNNINIEKDYNNKYRLWWNQGEIDSYSSDNTLTVGQPVTVTVIYDKTNGIIKIYEDNRLVATWNNPTFKNTYVWQDVLLGKDLRTGDTESTALNGNVYSLRVYDRVLTSDEIAQTVIYDTFKDSYTQKNYINGAGNAYLNTEFVPNSDSKLMMEYSANNTTFGAIFGARQHTSGSVFVLWGGQNGGTNYFPHYGHSTYTDLTSSKPIPLTANQKMLIDYNRNAISLKNLSTGTIYSYTASSSTFDSGYQLYFYTVYDNTGLDTRLANGKMYYAKLWNNGALARWFVPAVRNSDGVSGLYCMKTNKFYTSTSGTHFTSG